MYRYVGITGELRPNARKRFLGRRARGAIRWVVWLYLFVFPLETAGTLEIDPSYPRIQFQSEKRAIPAAAVLAFLPAGHGLAAQWVTLAAVIFLVLGAVGFVVHRRLRRKTSKRLRNAGTFKPQAVTLRARRWELLYALDVVSHGAVAATKSVRRLTRLIGFLRPEMASGDAAANRWRSAVREFLETDYTALRDIVGLARSAEVERELLGQTERSLHEFAGLVRSLVGANGTPTPGALERAEAIRQAARTTEEGFRRIRRAVVGYFSSDLRRTVERVLENRGREIIRLGLEVTPPDWSVLQSYVCRIDPGELLFIVDNLVGNAIRAMKAAPRRTLSIEIDAAGGRASMDVIDTGVGMTHDHWNRITESKAPSRPGGGLGLLHTRAILEKYGGRLSLVRTEPGKGTTLRLELPLALREGSDAGADVPVGRLTDTSRLKRARIGLVIAMGLVGVFWGLYEYAVLRATSTVDGNRIEAHAGLFGWKLWESQYVAPIESKATAPWPGKKIVVYGLGGHASDTGRLFVRHLATGKELWQDAPDLAAVAAVFGREMAGAGGFRCRKLRFADIDGDGRAELIAYYGHILYKPAYVRIYRRDGSRFGTYYHNGLLYAMQTEDIDGDGKAEIVLAGTNNAEAYQGATIILLDDQHCTGASRDSRALADCPLPDSSRVRVIFPRFDPRFMDILKAPRLEAYSITTSRNPMGEIEISVEVGTSDVSFIVKLDRDLVPLSIAPTNDFFTLRTAYPELLGDPSKGFLSPAYLSQWLGGHYRFEVGKEVRPRREGRDQVTQSHF